MSITLANLRTRLNNQLNDQTNIWSTTVKNQALNAGIALLYPFNFLAKQDTTQVTDIDAPTYIYSLPSDCEKLCQVYVSDDATQPKTTVVPWRWLRETNQVEIATIKYYNDAKTITVVYEAVHPQLTNESDTLAPSYKADIVYEAVLYWASVQCWRAKQRQNIEEVALKDYIALVMQDYPQFERMLRACAMPRLAVVNE